MLVVFHMQLNGPLVFFFFKPVIQDVKEALYWYFRGKSQWEFRHTLVWVYKRGFRSTDTYLEWVSLFKEESVVFFIDFLKIYLS